METFKQLVDKAVSKAVNDAAPFVPSRAEYEHAINEIVISRLKCMDKSVAIEYIRHSYSVGWCTVAVRMFKESIN